jgi:hypothetical protein
MIHSSYTILTLIYNPVLYLLRITIYFKQKSKRHQVPSMVNSDFRMRISLSFPDWFYCTLLRSGNPLSKSSDIKSRIPDRRFISHEHSIQSLPIDKTSTRDNLLHLIESTKSDSQKKQKLTSVFKATKSYFSMVLPQLENPFGYFFV